MSSAVSFDDELARRLPLPLARLYRQAHNAKTALDRHQAAYFLWEASLKLLGSAAIVTYAQRTEVDPRDRRAAAEFGAAGGGALVGICAAAVAGAGRRGRCGIQIGLRFSVRAEAQRSAALCRAGRHAVRSAGWEGRGTLHGARERAVRQPGAIPQSSDRPRCAGESNRTNTIIAWAGHCWSP